MGATVHILFLTDNFPPEVNAPASRTHEHCSRWVAAGAQVTVITGVPNFPKGRVFPGYRNRLWQQEVVDGIRVIRVWTYITPNEGFGLRVLDYLSFMASAIVASIFVRRVDVIIGTSPQFFTAVAAGVLSFLKRTPFIFELRDLWPESIKAVGAMGNSRVYRLLERVELLLYRRAHRVVSVTYAFRETLANRGVDPRKVEVVTNGVDFARFSPRPRDAELEKALGWEGCFVIGYVGTHGMAHGLETLIEAMQLLESHPEGQDVRMLMLGDGACKRDLEAHAARLGLSSIKFVDTVPKSEVVRYWSLLDLSIIHLRRTPLFKTVIPSKLFECMGMGIPVLHGVEGESAAIVQREAVGLVFEPENSEELAAAVLSLRRDATRLGVMRAAALAAAPRYDRGHLAIKMLSVVSEVARGRRAEQWRD
jgi:glycosyltransferase involved in cell wall biosynthesis